MYSDNSNLIKKFEKMISDDSSIFLDTDEVEEIILYYFNEGDIMMASNNFKRLLSIGDKKALEIIKNIGNMLV